MNTFLPFIVIGVTTGSIYGLAATGLVLSYKTSGIFNFAYGAIAALAVFTFYFLHVEHGVAWPIAAVLSVFVLGPLMGLLLEVLARRLSRVNHMLQIAATIGLILWIVGLGSIWISNASGSFPSFLPTKTVRLASVNIQWQQLIVVAISLLSAIGLSLFLRVTRLGRAMRGVVDDPDLVAMTGQSPTVVRRWSWVISTTFACLAGILIAPSLPVDATVLTLLVVTAFGAAAIGYFSNLPLVYAGGLFIGIVGALTTKYASSVPWLINLPAGLPFIILIVVLIVTPRARLQARRFTVPLSVPPSWHAPARVRIGFGALVVVALCFVPALVGTKLTVYSSVLILAVLILSLGVLTRTSRQVSLCQYAFAAIGGAAMGHFTSQMGIPWFLALLLAGLVTVPIGALIAIPAIRLSGVFLALATLGFGILVQNIFYTQNYMFGSTGNGISVARPSFSVGGLNLGSDKGYYFVILVVTVLMTLLTIAVSDGRLGRMLRAMGDSPLALESYGLSVNTTKVLIFCVSSFIAAISGALLSGLYHFGLGTNFPSFSSLTIFAVAVVIAVGTPWYALIGASILTLVPVYLTSSNVVLWLNVVFGIGAVLNPVFRDKMPGTPEWIRQLAAGLGGSAKVPEVAPGGVQTSPQVAAASTAPGQAADQSGLVVSGVTVRFGGTVAVNDVSFTAPRGRITGLIGPNGAGKTTTFNACSGLVRPSAGLIELDGQALTSSSVSARARNGLGRTFQRVQLFESLTVKSNIELSRECGIAGRNPLRQLRSTSRESREVLQATQAAVELTGIGSLMGLPVRELSTGQRRLVEMARVLSSPFDMILLDEPSSGLDQTETAQLGDILLRVVSESGIGLLLVEHDMSMVRRVCDHVYVLDFGNLIFDGSVDEMAESEVVRAVYLGTDEDLIEAAAEAEAGAITTQT